MKRLFLAIPINIGEDFQTLFNELHRNLAHEHNINWVNNKQVHLTLKFIGNCSYENEIHIIDAVGKMLENYHPFEINFDKVGIFGSRYAPRVLWLGPTINPETLISLANTTLTTFDNIGFERTTENFVPHLTLCRIKSLCDKQYFQKVIHNIEPKTFIHQQVDKIILFQSILEPTGAVYKIEKEWMLK